jgi:hypothetical protein
MKHFNRRAISAALIITLGVVFSVNASAGQTTSLENSISKMVLAQGQQVMSDLTEQLQQSIKEEINSFTIDFSFDESITESIAWLSDDTNVEVKDTENVKSELSPTTDIKLLK